MDTLMKGVEGDSAYARLAAAVGDSAGTESGATDSAGTGR